MKISPNMITEKVGYCIVFHNSTGQLINLLVGTERADWALSVSSIRLELWKKIYNEYHFSRIISYSVPESGIYTVSGTVTVGSGVNRITLSQNDRVLIKN